MKRIRIFLILILAVSLFSCTKLDESFRGELEQADNSSITASGLLINAYNSIGGSFQGNGNIWSTTNITTDEAIAPTRGPDWYDNGLWQALHAHTWNPDHEFVAGAFTEMLVAQFNASNVLQYNPTAQQAAEARFLRALSMYWVLDGYDQVPYREDLTDYKILPITLKGLEAADFIISELNDIIADLPDTGPAYTANKNAARALLMKIYLNKGVYANRAAPTFDPADMNKVISLADEIINSNKYTLNDNFFDIFAPDNDVKSKESIYSFYNSSSDNRGANVRGFAFMVSHYNMNPSGWNGFATLSDFYDKFDPTDKRLGGYYPYPAGLPNPGKRTNVGFLIGRQYNLTTDAPLNARNPSTAPLSFTREVKINEPDPNTLEFTGIRVMKYPYDYAAPGDQKNNDYVMFRLADVLLMKAEAILRGGTGTAAGPYGSTALEIVNSIRTKRGASALASADLNALLDERGREMYWECWRRNDLIRFGKFLQAWQEKAADNGTTNLLFPIPSNQLAVNPNLTQNPGYNN
ncbi:RagB/SusD family nutrient uptake outer membrane protein [Terrimonas alba]|uniref:RagB/SusD family nutrient uptake outer membrane protein n=1 Tax=Terrimonas alba TaxID=3349636 RepID=UPI0035F4D9F3